MEEVILTKEQLLMKSEGVRDCVKWIISQIKVEKEELLKEEKDERGYGMFEDCGQFYSDLVTKRKGRIDAMIDMKIGLEKYMKKLRHMAEEV